MASRGHSSSRCAGLSLSRPLLLQSTGSRRAGSVVVAHGPSCSTACGILPDQGSKLCPLHWQVDSQPLRHQGSPEIQFLSDRFLPSSFTDATPGSLLESMASSHCGDLCAHWVLDAVVPLGSLVPPLQDVTY